MVADANGNTVKKIGYEPYGVPTNGLIFPENGSFEKCSSGKLNGDPSLGTSANFRVFSYRWKASMSNSPADEYCEVADSSTAAEGGKIGRIYDSGSGTWKAFTFNTYVTLTPGKWYRISVKARVISNPGVKYAKAYLSYNGTDSSGSKYVTKLVTWTSAELAGGDWVQKYVTFQVPVGYNNLSVSPFLYGHYGAGTVEYDDYRIEEFDSDPVGPPAVNQESEVNFDSDSRFTNKLGSAETGLVYFGARWYDPELGRFISRDPAKDGLNWYIYAADNPLKFIDTDGKRIVFAENTTKQQISDFNKAVAYLEKNSTIATGLITKIQDSNEVITIKIDNDAGIGSFTPWNKTITWDPTSAWHVASKNKNATPALELAHEMGHAAQLIDGEYGNDRPDREERDVRKWETPIAKQLGEPWRNYYKDFSPWAIETEGPTSNEEVKEE